MATRGEDGLTHYNFIFLLRGNPSSSSSSSFTAAGIPPVFADTEKGTEKRQEGGRGEEGGVKDKENPGYDTAVIVQILTVDSSQDHCMCTDTLVSRSQQHTVFTPLLNI